MLVLFLVLSLENELEAAEAVVRMVKYLHEPGGWEVAVAVTTYLQQT